MSSVDNWPSKASVANVLSTSAGPYCSKNFRIFHQCWHNKYFSSPHWDGYETPTYHKSLSFNNIQHTIGSVTTWQEQDTLILHHIGKWSKTTPLGQTTCRNAGSNLSHCHNCVLQPPLCIALCGALALTLVGLFYYPDGLWEHPALYATRGLKGVFKSQMIEHGYSLCGWILCECSYHTYD